MSKAQELFVPGALWKRPPPPVKKPLRKLTAKEQENVARIKAQIMEYMPDMAPLFNELHKAGLIDGWRSVGEIVLFKEGNEHGTA